MPRACEYSSNIDKKGKTPLHLAAKIGHVEVCRALIGLGADVSVIDKKGKISLHQAAHSGYPELCTVLVEQGAQVNALDKNGRAPLHDAAKFGHVGVCKVLIRLDAEVNAVDVDEKMSLHLAANHAHAEVCSVLVELGAHVDASDKNGRTPFHSAARNGHTDTCNMIITSLTLVGATEDRVSEIQNRWLCFLLCLKRCNICLAKDLLYKIMGKERDGLVFLCNAVLSDKTLHHEAKGQLRAYFKTNRDRIEKFLGLERSHSLVKQIKGKLETLYVRLSLEPLLVEKESVDNEVVPGNGEYFLVSRTRYYEEIGFDFGW